MDIIANVLSAARTHAHLIHEIKAGGYPAARAYTNGVYSRPQAQDVVARCLTRAAAKFEGPWIKRDGNLIMFPHLGHKVIDYDLCLQVDASVETAVIAASLAG
jgi:hypothetical protein